MSRMRGMGPRGFLTDEEKQNAPKITKELIFRILKYLKPYWFQMLIVFAIIIFNSMVNNTDIGVPFWFLQIIPAMVLAHARDRSKFKALLATLFTVGLFPFFSAIKGLLEVRGMSVKDRQLEQQEILNSIQQMDEQIAATRRSLGEINSQLEEHEAHEEEILV